MAFLNYPLIAVLTFAAAVSAQALSREGLPADPAVTFGTLENGLAYAIMPHEEPPGRVSLRLLVEAGSLQETDAQAGLAHFLEHMAFNGSENYAPGELVEYLQRMGMGFGADTNAHTSFNETVYKLELPEASEAYLREGFQVLGDYAGGLLLLEEEIDRERGVIKAELLARDSVGYRTWLKGWQFLLPESLLVQRFPIGELEVIENATRDLFFDYYQTWYRPDRMAVIVVGEVSPEVVVPLIEATFAGLENPETAPPQVDLGTITNPGLSVGVHLEPEAPATEVSLYAIRAFERGEDSRARRIQRIREGLANGILNRRLERLAREEGAPIASGSAYAWDYLDFMDVSGVDVVAKPGQWRKAVTLLDAELRRALQFGFQEAELAEVVAERLRSAEQAVAAADTRKSRELSSSLVNALSSKRAFISPETQLTLVQAAVEDFSVDDASAAFRELWADEDRFLWMTGPIEADASEESLTDDLRATYLAAQERVVEAPEAIVAADWAYDDFGPAGEFVDEMQDDTLNLVQAALNNGVRVNFKQTDFEANTVRVTLNVGLGMLEMSPDQRGWDLVANQTFVQGGLGAHNWDEVQRVLAGKNVGVNFSVGEDAFRLSGQTTPEDFRQQLELLAAYLIDPAYRDEALREAQSGFEQMYVSLARTPEGVLADRVEHFLHGGSWRGGYPDQATLMAITMENVRALVGAPLASAYLEVSVVGDLSWDAAKPALAATFGALPERTSEPPQRPEPAVVFPRGLDLAEFDFASEIPKGRVMVYWPTTDMMAAESIGAVRRLNLLARMLGDRLRVRVREELGEGYSPFARHSSSEVYRGYGYLMMANVASVDRLRDNAQLLAETAHSALERPFTADELRRSLDPLLKFLEEYHRNNNYWLNRVLAGSQARPHLLDWAKSMREDYESITLAEIQQLAETYLGPERELTVLVRPVAAEAEPEAY